MSISLLSKVNFIRYPFERTLKKAFRCSFYGVFFVALFSIAWSIPAIAQESEMPIASSGKKRNPETPPTGHLDLNDLKSSDPDSLWYHYNKKSGNRPGDIDYPSHIPTGIPFPSETYNPDAYPHLKRMAKYCTYDWKNEKCMHTLSALGIALTKDYVKKIHFSETVPASRIEHSKKEVKQACVGILPNADGKIVPDKMSIGMKQCVGKINTLSKDIREYPDQDFRQLALSSTFCLVMRQEQCDMVEGQLVRIAKPEMAYIKPAQDSGEEETKTEPSAPK